jgi:hypothetical protein
MEPLYVLSTYQHTYPSFQMPKSTFNIPLGNVIEHVTETWRTWRGNCTTEKQVPFHLDNAPKDANASSSKKSTGTQASDSTVNVKILQDLNM